MQLLYGTYSLSPPRVLEHHELAILTGDLHDLQAR
jgi:hypothetical protein